MNILGVKFMVRCNKKSCGIIIAGALFAPVFIQPVMAQTVTDALTSGTAYGDFRLRYETVTQDNELKDASALTLRSRIGYNTGSVSNFSAGIEFEDSRVVAGFDSYGGDYSVIADPETTELDQLFVKYQTDTVTSKLGRQVITLDNHRHVGHVGWRQDRQTFDALTLVATPVEKLTVNYSFIGQRNRIFSEAADIKSKDNLLNISYVTPVGKIVGYGYFLEEDKDQGVVLDTIGFSFKGKSKAGDLKVFYGVDYASQSWEAAGTERDTSYSLLEAGVWYQGITAKLGYEVLGSDGGEYGFQTPLATLHKFNGWGDQFLVTPGGGLVDTHLSFAGKVLGGSWKIIYHSFAFDEAVGGSDDIGNELDLDFTKKISKNYTVGIRYAAFKAESGSGKTDTDKLWLWAGASF